MVKGRGGFALVATVVLGVAITLLALTALLLGTAQERAAIMEVERVEAAQRAHVALVASVEALRSGGPLPVDVVAERLGSELVLLRAGGPGSGRVGLVWRGDVEARLRALEAGVEVDLPPAPGAAARILSTSADVECAPGIRAPPLPPWRRSAAAPSPLRFGPIERRDLEAELPALPPRIEGPPATGVVGFASHDVTFAGLLGPIGAWIEGNVEIAAGADVTGYLQATGRVELGHGARFSGVLRSHSVELAPGAEIVPRPCALAEVLAANPALLAPRALHPLGWPLDAAPTR